MRIASLGCAALLAACLTPADEDGARVDELVEPKLAIDCKAIMSAQNERCSPPQATALPSARGAARPGLRNAISKHQEIATVKTARLSAGSGFQIKQLHTPLAITLLGERKHAEGKKAAPKRYAKLLSHERKRLDRITIRSGIEPIALRRKPELDTGDGPLGISGAIVLAP